MRGPKASGVILAFRAAKQCARFGFALVGFALVGLARLSTIANSLYTALADSTARAAAFITFAVTASGIGSAFWGLVAGVIATQAFKNKT